jgi:hypothetical protein
VLAVLYEEREKIATSVHALRRKFEDQFGRE